MGTVESVFAAINEVWILPEEGTAVPGTVLFGGPWNHGMGKWTFEVFICVYDLGKLLDFLMNRMGKISLFY